MTGISFPRVQTTGFIYSPRKVGGWEVFTVDNDERTQYMYMYVYIYMRLTGSDEIVVTPSNDSVCCGQLFNVCIGLHKSIDPNEDQITLGCVHCQ
jgi:hypothetical protein